MRHGKKIAHLGRTSSHRKAMMANMASSLIEHKRINTTVAKAKALKKFVEPLITKAKSDTTHNRRVVFSALRNKYAVSELFRDIADRVADRPGGYTRIIKVGSRMGDNASMAMIELVDFNVTYVTNKPAKKRSRRRLVSKKKADAATVAIAAEANEELDEDFVDNELTKEVNEETSTTDAAAKKSEKVEEAPVEEVKSEKEEGAAEDSSTSADQTEQNDEESKENAAE